MRVASPFDRNRRCCYCWPWAFCSHIGRQSVVLAQPREGVPLSVYSRQAYYTVPLMQLNGQSYVGLVELLEPLGTVDARVDGKKLKLKFAPPAVAN